MDSRPPHRGSLIAAGTLLGAGLGGFLDGILLRQLLQWHNMLSSAIPPVDLPSAKYNMRWDGLFHALTWVMTAVGLGLLWRAGQRRDVPWSTRTFVGSLVLGWGLFNVVEGTIAHHLLALHHVHPGAAQRVWDVGFLLFGAALGLAGWSLIREGSTDEAPRGLAAGGRLAVGPGRP